MYLFFSLSFGDIISADFDARLEEGLGHFSHVHAKKVSNLLGDSVVWQRRLIRITLLLELHVAEE